VKRDVRGELDAREQGRIEVHRARVLGGSGDGFT
jgi:hypothetical protein